MMLWHRIKHGKMWERSCYTDAFGVEHDWHRRCKCGREWRWTGHRWAPNEGTTNG